MGGVTTGNVATASVEAFDVLTAEHDADYGAFMYEAAGMQLCASCADCCDRGKKERGRNLVRD